MHRTAIVSRVDPADTVVDLPVVTDEASPAPEPRKEFFLRVISGPDAGRVLVLDSSSPPHTVVGNASACTLQLSDRHVSRKHIALTATAQYLLLMDIGSTNGTRVNGVLVREARLHGGETIALGRTVVGVEVDEAGVRRPPTLPPPANEMDFLAAVVAQALPFSEARHRVIAEFERRYVEAVLLRHNGNVTHAARASGLAHRYFQLVRSRLR